MRALRMKIRGLLVGILIGVTKFLARLKDKNLLAVLRVASAVGKLTVFHKAPNNPLEEIAEIIRDDERGNRALRALILEGRPQQLRSFVRGMLTHYVLPKTSRAIPVVRPAKRPKRAARKLDIGLIGEHPSYDAIRRAYESVPNCRTISDAKLVDPADLLNDCHALEFVSVEKEKIPLVESVIRRKKPLSLSYESLRKSEELRNAVAWAPADAPIRIWHPSLYYPPVMQVRKILDAQEIGEITTIRLRALLGKLDDHNGPGKTPNEYMKGPFFDHYPLLSYIGGDMDQCFRYLNNMDADKGGQGVVSIKFKRPGLYGSLECAWAPEMLIHSEELPLDIELEIAGTDGIIWLRGGPGQIAPKAPIRVRAGKSSYTLGVESGMGVDWSAVYENLTFEFARIARGKAKRPNAARAVASALQNRAF